MNKAILTLGIVSVWGVAGCSTWQIYNSNADVIKTDTQIKIIEADVDKTYASLDDALQAKDIPVFATRYEEARQFVSTLQDDTYIRYLTEGNPENSLIINIKQNAGSSLEKKLTKGDDSIYPVLYELVAYTPTLVENWPTDCYGDETILQYTDALITFGQERIDTANNKKSEDWQFQTAFSEDFLEASRTAGILGHTPNGYQFIPEGRHSPFSYRVPANVFTFALLDVTETGMSGRSIDYDCNIIDLGADGIDACDARLNGISVEQIPQANQQYRNCLEITKTKLAERYPESFL